jgi:hypothetical protein
MSVYVTCDDAIKEVYDRGPSDDIPSFRFPDHKYTRQIPFALGEGHDLWCPHPDPVTKTEMLDFFCIPDISLVILTMLSGYELSLIGMLFDYDFVFDPRVCSDVIAFLRRMRSHNGCLQACRLLQRVRAMTVSVMESVWEHWFLQYDVFPINAAKVWNLPGGFMSSLYLSAPPASFVEVYTRHLGDGYGGYMMERTTDLMIFVGMHPILIRHLKEYLNLVMDRVILRERSIPDIEIGVLDMVCMMRAMECPRFWSSEISFYSDDWWGHSDRWDRCQTTRCASTTPKLLSHSYNMYLA